MAPSPSFDSVIALENLQKAAIKNTQKAPDLSLPVRPRNLSPESVYSNEAIGIVSVYTEHLYNEHGSWSIQVSGVREDVNQLDNNVTGVREDVNQLDNKVTGVREDVNQLDNKVTGVREDVNQLDKKVTRFEHGVKGALTSLSNRLNDVEEDLSELKSQVKDVQSQVKDVQSQVKDVQSQVKDVQSQVKDVQSQVKELTSQVKEQIKDVRSQVIDLSNLVQNGRAIQLNSLRKWLDDDIEPVSALVQINGRITPDIAADFPKSIRHFWNLKSNTPALVLLANHYSITNWEQWLRSTSDDTDRTEFGSLEIAVSTCPDRCLQSLAGKWGLEYSRLQRPRPKRVIDVDDDWEHRRVRTRIAYENEIVESIISQDEHGELTRQDQIIRIGPRQPARSQEVISYREVRERYPREPGGINSQESAVLGWDHNYGLSSKKSHGSEKRS